VQGTGRNLLVGFFDQLEINKPHVTKAKIKGVASPGDATPFIQSVA
jgi:hypothetical protein